MRLPVGNDNDDTFRNSISKKKSIRKGKQDEIK